MIRNSISKIRKELNITQEQLANSLKVSRQTIISLENNKNNISLELAFDIANFFNKPINEVFFEEDLNNMNSSVIEDIKEKYGKFTIIIKGNLVFRCSTEVLEIGPEYLLDLELPLYGKMKKFIILNNKVYELIPTREYKNRNDYVKHTVGNEVNINWSIIDFNEENAWNYKK